MKLETFMHKKHQTLHVEQENLTIRPYDLKVS